MEIPQLCDASVSGKTVIVTGGARGIGASTSMLYNVQGANVVVADLGASREAARALIQTFPHPSKAAFVEVDILNWDQMKLLFATASKRFGQIDIVVANAGIMEQHESFALDKVDNDGALLESKEAFRVIDINLKGTLNSKLIFARYGLCPSVDMNICAALRLAMHAMKDRTESQGEGSIVLIASTSGYFGGTGVAAYVASKHGVVGLLRACQETASKHGIRVNAVAPFFTPTQITSSFAGKWNDAGLEANTPDSVAELIFKVSKDSGKRGECVMVSSSTMS